MILVIQSEIKRLDSENNSLARAISKIRNLVLYNIAFYLLLFGGLLFFYLKVDQINMSVFFLYFVKSELYSLRQCTPVHCTGHFFQSTRTTRPCLSGDPAGEREKSTNYVPTWEGSRKKFHRIIAFSRGFHRGPFCDWNITNEVICLVYVFSGFFPTNFPDFPIYLFPCPPFPWNRPPPPLII